ncbi:MAG: RdgB/HAM1 family non-canonical purine NTP pyrophosphatase [Candidatus Omnitrophica bacterium]|nr:RdgB/HAM1 family non-canonical purine NTP pyrophosphatase [Candidatus Omnitrophota bacterium]
MLDIVIATRNLHKFRELKQLLNVPGIRWRSLREFPRAGKVRETGRTYAANARKKALAVARATGGLAVADDSGLEVDALRGAPGVRSARFAGGHGGDQANNRKLLRLLGHRPMSQRRARYRCVLALARPGRVIRIVDGDWKGCIAFRPSGSQGFGYDPVFVVPRLGKTVGQLPARVKQRWSHRAAASRKLRPVLRRLTK